MSAPVVVALCALAWVVGGVLMARLAAFNSTSERHHLARARGYSMVGQREQADAELEALR